MRGGHEKTSYSGPDKDHGLQKVGNGLQGNFEGSKSLEAGEQNMQAEVEAEFEEDFSLQGLFQGGIKR